MTQVRIQSVGRASDLLHALGDGGWHTLGSLAAAVGLAKGTAHNLIGALTDCALVEHDPARGSYRLGVRVLALGRAVERRLDLLPLLRPLLVRLSAETGETVNLAVPRPADVLIIESLEGTRHGVRVSSYAGTTAAYHSTACGRVLLAHRPEAERRALYALGPLTATTPATITDPARLERVLAECRARGWAEEREENEPGACCVAAPVLGPGAAVAAISIAGPAARMDSATTARLGEMLRDALRPVESRFAA